MRISLCIWIFNAFTIFLNSIICLLGESPADIHNFFLTVLVAARVMSVAQKVEAHSSRVCVI
jgi:hypothetical protein